MAKKISLKDPDILNQIAKAIKEGANPEDFDSIIDKLLGTEMTERDLEKDQAWQDEFGGS